MVSELINANPVVYERKERRTRSAAVDVDEYAIEPIDQLEIFDILLYVLDLFFCGLFRICLLPNFVELKNLFFY
ncbi:hypothetical protein ACS0TY_021772 [Phlomoides rotata]